MVVKIRGYRGYILNMERHEISNVYEIQLQARGNTQIKLHDVKPEEIEILKEEE